MKKNNKTESLVLRQKAEEQLKIRNESAGTDVAFNESTATETLKLIHEFEVHQIELEIQNHELTLAKEQAIIDCEKYIELYDLAPTGYFTLSRDGEIIQLNITGAKMLGKARSHLKNRLFHLFVSDNSKPFFLHFLEKVFDRHEKEICELTIPTNDDIPMYIYITGIVSGNGSNCLITAIDITERKLLESGIVEKMILLYETERAGKIGGWSFNVKTLTQNFTQETFNILEIDSAYGEPKVPEGIEFIDDSCRHSAELAIKRAIEFGEPFVQEWNVITGKGNKRWINVVGKANWVKGKINSITGSFQDITERKQAEEALLASEKKYHAIFDNVQDVFYQTDLAGTVLDVSPSIKHFSDFNRDEIIGKPVTNLYYDLNDRVELLDFLQKEGEFVDYELRLKTRTGELRYVSNNARLVFDSDGRPNHIDGEIKDITQRKLAEIELQASKDFLNNIINAVASPVFVKDENHKCVLVNNALCSFLEIPKEKIIGSTDSEYFPEEQVKVFIEKENEVLKTGKENCSEEFVTDKTGNVRTIVARKTLYTDTLGNKFLVGVINDITERKLAEKHIERLNRVYSVLSNINKTIIRVRDKQFLFEEACRIAVENGGFKMAWMGMVNSATNKIDVVATSGITGEFINYINIDLNNEALNSGPAGMTIKTGKCNFSNNIQTDYRKFYWREKALEYGYQSIIALPVIIWGKIIGVYMIYSGEIDFFNEDEIKLLEEMASDISFALEFIETEKEHKKAEKALRESTRIINDSQAIAHIGASVLELTASELEANVWIATPEIYKIFGIDETYPHTLAGWAGFIHPDSREELIAYYYQVVDERKRFDHEYKIIRINDGAERWVHGTGEIEFDNQHNPIRMLGTIQDITERKESQAELIEKEVQFRNLSNAGLALIWTAGTDKLCNYFNEKWLTFTGRKLEQEMGNGWAQGVHPDDFDRCVETYVTAFDKREPFEMEYRLLHASGEYRWLLDIGSPNYKSTGEFVGYIGNCFDITDRKRTEEALRKSEAIQRKIVSNIGDVIVIVDENGINRYKSPNIETLFGWNPEEMVGKSIWDVVHPDDLDSSQKIVAEIALIPNATETSEIRYRRKDGVYVWIEVTIVNLLFDPEIQGFLGNYHDITDRRLAQEKIREKDLEFKKLSSNLPDLIFQFTRRPDGTYYVPIASEGIQNIFGCSPEDVINDFTPISRVIHPDDVEKVIADIEYSAKHLTFLTCEFRVLIPGKPIQWIYTKSTPEKLPDGSVTWYGFNADITDRKLGQEKLLESDERFNLAMKASKDGLFDLNLETNKIYYSPGWKKIIGYKDHELPNDISVWIEATEPLGVSKSYELHQKLISKEITRIVLELKMKHKNGHWVDILSQATAIFNKEGKAIRIVGTHTDISERKRTEESLIKLKTAIDKSEISVVITDRNGNIEYANPFFSKLTGYSPDEYIGKTPRILKSEYHTKEFYEEMWNTIISGKTWEGEFYNCNKNGEMYWENAIISPVTNSNNEITHFVAIKTDITHAKNTNSELIIAKEHAEESDRLKSAFLANMSHEIRTPMNGILGFTELLKEPDLSDEQRKYFIGIIEKSGERLLNIINDIIDISKIESGLMKVKNTGINVNEYLDQILTFFKPEAEAKNIKLICKPGLPREEAFLETDSEKFYAILINLVKNALKYTETGFVEFGYNRVKTLHSTSLPNHSYLQFYVKDTGIGIPKDRLEAIFERFVQADIFDKMARQGAGLGLSISKAYVEMLRGKIWVESVEGIGSTFYFTLPRFANPKENAIVTSGVHAIVEGNMVGRMKILIAEDDETSSKLISIRVRKFGSEIINVETGTAAVEACRANPDIDLILMDIQMPEMSGYEATRQIRQFNSEVIIIALTAFALAGDREKSIEAGCNDYISKPIQKNELVEMIQKYFTRFEDGR